MTTSALPFVTVTSAAPAVEWQDAVDAIHARAYVAEPGSLAAALGEFTRDRCRASFALLDAEHVLRDAMVGSDPSTRSAIRRALQHIQTADDLIGRGRAVVETAGAMMRRTAR